MEAGKNNGKGKGSIKKIMLVSLGILGTGALGYWGWKKLKGTKPDNTDFQEAETISETVVKKDTAASYQPSTSIGDKFPLRKGSIGARVKKLQEALIRLYNSNVGTNGADGIFGSKTQAALQENGHPTEVDEDTFNSILAKETGNAKTSGDSDTASIAKNIFSAALRKDFAAALTELRKINTVESYSAVSNEFKTKYRLNMVRKTLVNGMFDSFTKDEQRQELFNQFKRMGLKYDGAKWSLSGLAQGVEIITVSACPVYTVNRPIRKIDIRKNIVLGKKEFSNAEWVFFKPYRSHELYKVKRQYVKKYK